MWQYAIAMIMTKICHDKKYYLRKVVFAREKLSENHFQSVCSFE